MFRCKPVLKTFIQDTLKLKSFSPPEQKKELQTDYRNNYVQLFKSGPTSNIVIFKFSYTIIILIKML